MPAFINTSTTEGAAVEVEAALREPAAAVDRFLRSVVDALEAPTTLREAVRYALLGGGKRLRPVLCWHATEAVGGPGAGPRSLPAAASLELVHAFSLVHDDLPAMDDDDLRRGRPTLHVHAGEAMAILAGDAMLAMAFAALRVPAPGRPAFPAALRGTLIDELSTGTLGMIGGQVYDTLGDFPDGLDDAGKVERIHANKTGALLIAACRMGALVATGGEEDDRVAAVTEYGRAIGLMFQAVDDLIDVEQSAEHTGKRTGKDAAAGKLTYPAVFGVEGARARVGELRDLAMAALEPLGEQAAGLRRLGLHLAERTK